MCPAQEEPSPATVVVSNRELLARGVLSYLAERAPTTRNILLAGPLRSPLALAAGRIGLALVDVHDVGSPDRLRGCDELGTLRADPRLRSATLVSVVEAEPSTAVQLRLVEAGSDRWLLLDDLLRHPELLTMLISVPTDPMAAHPLPPRAKLRRELGLRIDGNANELVSAVRHFPVEVWIGRQSQDDLPVSRRDIQRIRQQAERVGGLPPPDPSRFATVLRNPPIHPEWATVRSMVAELMGQSHPRSSPGPRG